MVQNQYHSSGIDLESAVVKVDNGNYLSPIPSSATQGANTVFSFDADVNIHSSGSCIRCKREYKF